jgi:hypothetical protein
MFKKTILLFLLTILAVSSITFAQNVPAPKEHFGFAIGDDYQLTTFTQTEAYFKKLAEASDRVELTSIGLTEEGRNQYMLIISSPQNLKNLAKYKEISQKLARAEGLTPEHAKALAADGKAVVWIDGGLHATETVGIHQLIETAYQLASRSDAETKRILDNVIILMTHANPDGQELVSNWYMREKDPKKRTLEFLPRLYQKYIGHDNNRDFYMMQMKESQNMGRQLFVEWMPQIMYNHHQRGPAGSVLAGPPYRDPFNYVFDPLMITGIDAVGAAMYNRLNVENKPGYTRLTGSTFSTWYNGGLRTTTQFHNMIGLLTEIIGGPTPEEIPLVPTRLIPNGATPNPVTPQTWHFRQSIDYSLSLNFSVLDYAARNYDDLLFNIYHMGKNSIDRGNMDFWTPYPKRIDAINEAMKANKPALPASATTTPAPKTNYYDLVLRDSTLRDARGYIIPANQTDFPTAVKFINALMKAGIQIQKASADFTVAGKKYPAGSYIVKSSQAFRPHILDMFEPQDHPNDFQYAGGPPIRPYDGAGWTLAYQMGVSFDRILTEFSGPFTTLPYGELQTVKTVVPSGSVAGYELSPVVNNSFTYINDLLAAGIEVFRITSGKEQGTFFVPSSAKAKSALASSAAELGSSVKTVGKRPANLTKVVPARVALWDNYGGSMPSGWVRWIMEQYHFPIQLVYAKDIDAGDLRKKYDMILFVTRAIPGVGNAGSEGSFTRKEAKEEDVPGEFHKQMGSLTVAKSIPALKKFMEEGGSVFTIGSSTSLAYHIGLPIRNALMEMTASGVERTLPNDKYFIPGSILQVAVDSTQKTTWGMRSKSDVYFDASPVFNLSSDAVSKGMIKPLMWFDSNKPLRSGWAWGQAYLQDGVTAFEANVGKGKLIAFGPEITFRAQSYGTFKLLFNQLYSSQN